MTPPDWAALLDAQINRLLEMANAPGAGFFERAQSLREAAYLGCLRQTLVPAATTSPTTPTPTTPPPP